MKIICSWQFVNKDPENLGAFREINSCMWNRQPSSCIIHQAIRFRQDADNLQLDTQKTYTRPYAG